jgi:hypothetical protein
MAVQRHTSNSWITNIILHKHKSKKKRGGGDPPPQNPHRLSLIHEHNAEVSSRVVKPWRRRGLNLGGRASTKGTAKATRLNLGDEAPAKRTTEVTRLNLGGKASAKGVSTTTVAKHPLEKAWPSRP